MQTTPKSFTRYAWFVTVYSVFVIAWGAVVRATGSGGGCGNHWPHCNGEILPVLSNAAVQIEFGHRLTSGLSGILVIALLIWALRIPSGRLPRIAAGSGLFFILLEGGLGAMLVRLELVGNNMSALRAAVVALHLANTYLLVASLAVVAWSSQRAPVAPHKFKPLFGVLLGLGLAGTLVMSAAGAVTALGDTLFPSQTLAAGLAADISPAAGFLIRLRVIHPILAIVVTGYLWIIGQYLKSTGLTGRVLRTANWLAAFIVVQIAAGAVNVILLAPLWMQVVHLILANSVWLALVLLTTELVYSGD